MKNHLSAVPKTARRDNSQGIENLLSNFCISREKYFSYLENGIPYEGYVEGLGYALKEIEVVPTQIHAREQILSIAYKAALILERKKAAKRREEEQKKAQDKQKAIQAVSDHFNKKKRELGLFDPKNKEKIVELNLYFNSLKSKIEREQPIERDEIPMELFYGPEGEMIHRMFQKEGKEPDFFGVPIRFTGWISERFSSYAGKAINTQKVFISIFCFYLCIGCMDFSDPRVISVKNNSNQTIYSFGTIHTSSNHFEKGITHILKLNPKESHSNFKIETDSTGYIPCLPTRWKHKITKKKHIQVYIITQDSVDKYGWNEIMSQHVYTLKYSLNTDSLKNREWLVTFDQ